MKDSTKNWIIGIFSVVIIVGAIMYNLQSKAGRFCNTNGASYEAWNTETEANASLARHQARGDWGWKSSPCP